MELSTRDLLKILNKNIDNFVGVFAKDQLKFKIVYPSCFIVNTHESYKPGEHWLAIYFDINGNADFFDSYGNHPQFFNLESFLNKTSIKWNFNQKQLQSYSSVLCGYYCCLFLLCRNKNISMNEFVKKFSDYSLVNDLTLLQLIK